MIVTFRKTATHDVTKAASHLRDQAGDETANRFLQSIEDRIAMLREFPDSGRVVTQSGIRATLLSGFPYHLYYRLAGSSKLIVLRIRHAHRRPLTWL